MHRRTWLRAAAITAGALAAPAWLRRAFADTTVKPCEPGSTLTLGGHAQGDFGAQLARARASGRALLVIVVPEEAGRRSEREQQVGAWLLQSSDDSLAPLALADVVCTTATVMTKHGLRLPQGDLLFVVVSRSGEAAASHAPGKDHLTRMVAKLLPTGELSADTRAQLARKAARLRKDRIPGSTWTYMLGCNYAAPGDAQPTDEVSSIGCGMGGLGPHASQRFLRFYVGSRQG